MTVIKDNDRNTEYDVIKLTLKTTFGCQRFTRLFYSTSHFLGELEIRYFKGETLAVRTTTVNYTHYTVDKWRRDSLINAGER